MLPNAYCDLSFLDAATKGGAVDYLDPVSLANARHKYDLADLINDGLMIATNGTVDQLNERAGKNPCFKYLMKQGRLTIGATCMNQIGLNDGNFFKASPRIFDIFFVSEMMYKNQVGEWTEQSGCHFITAGCNHAKLFSEQVKNFIKGKPASWAFAKNMLLPHHSIVIADPYLYKRDTIITLANMLLEIAPSKLKGNYYITLIGSADNAGRATTVVEAQLKQDIISRLQANLASITVEHFYCESEDFHDRYLITNNTCVFSGYGIDTISHQNKTRKETTWIAFTPYRRMGTPSGQGKFFSQIIAEKLNVLKGWVGTAVTTNPLFSRLPI